LLVFGIGLGFALAFAIGANDVANSMATAVGSKAITPKQAVLIAAVLELSGAVLFGSHVTSTIMKGIVKWEFVSDPNILLLGAMATLISTTVWILVATFWSMPISTTHSVVGGMMGFGVVAAGWNAVNWMTMMRIALTWIISPLFGALLSYTIFKIITWTILHKDSPYNAAKKNAPYFIAAMFFIIAFLFCYKTLYMDLIFVILVALALSDIALLISIKIFSKRMTLEKPDNEYEEVEKIFRKMQVFTSCYVSFSHGANDVANAIGPLALIFAVLTTGIASTDVGVPIWILLLGGAGIATGVAVLGKKVMKTIGEDITVLNNTRGFAIDFGTATTVLIASVIGVPVSTTHTVVGSVTGIGMAKGTEMVNVGVLKNIIYSWLLTVPLVAGCSGALFWVLQRVIVL
jgi:PiT family inorganic phosphate transporter